MTYQGVNQPYEEFGFDAFSEFSRDGRFVNTKKVGDVGVVVNAFAIFIFERNESFDFDSVIFCKVMVLIFSRRCGIVVMNRHINIFLSVFLVKDSIKYLCVFFNLCVLQFKYKLTNLFGYCKKIKNML